MIDRIKKNIGKSTSIDNYLTNHSFLNLYPKGTMKMYRSHLKYFFKLVSGNKDTKDQNVDLNKFKRFVDNYFNNGHNYDTDMSKLIRTLDEDGYSNLTKKNRVNTIRVLMYENDVKLDKKLKKTLKNKYKSIRRDTDRIIPTHQQLKKIIGYAEPKAKALFLISCSSGMRIEEILQLTMDDIDLDYNPPKINVRAETAKTKMQRTTFMSDEAKEALLRWLGERDKYLETAVKKSTRTPKSKNDDTIFCFSYSVGRTIWNRLCDKAGFSEIDKSTGLRKISIQCLRSFFKHNTFEIGEVSELLLGHTDQNLNAYRDKYPLEKKAEKYLSVMTNLTILSTPPDLTETHLKIEQLRSDNDKLKELVEKMQMKMDILETKYELEKQKNGNK
jgi:integrase